MAHLANSLWEFTLTYSPMQLFNFCISKLDILDIVFVGFCLIGFAASILAHCTYHQFYPRGTESRRLWSPLAQHPGFLAPDLYNSPETCSWLNTLLGWLSKCSGTQLNTVQGTRNGWVNQRYHGIIRNCLMAANEAANGTAIAFQDISFGSSIPAVNAVSARICSEPGKELLLHARIFVPDVRLKVRVAHWQSDFTVQLVNSSAETEIELQLTRQPPRVSARLIGRPFVSDVRVCHIGGVGTSQSDFAARSDWLAGRVIALLGSAVVSFPLACGGVRLAARASQQREDKACQTEETFDDCQEQLCVFPPPFTSDEQLANDCPEAHWNLPVAASLKMNSCVNQSSVKSNPSSHEFSLPGLTKRIQSPVLTNENANRNGVPSIKTPPMFSTNQDHPNLPKSEINSTKEKTTSRLLVKVIRAAGIASAKSSSSVSRATVVCLELDEPRQTRQTRPAYGITNPYWDEHFVLDLNSKSTKLTVSLQRQQQQQQQISACLPLASLPSCGSRVLLPLPQSGTITLELLTMPSLSDEVAAKSDERVETATDDLPTADESPQLSRQVAEFMRPPPQTPQPVRLAVDQLSRPDASLNDRPKQVSDYAYAKQFGNKIAMEFQMSYKRRKAYGSRSIMDRISRALVSSNSGFGRSKW